MRWALAACLLVEAAAAPVARAEPFMAVGISLGSGPRGFTLGVEISGGAVGSGLVYGGGATGFEIAPNHLEHQPWGRLYLEAEGGWAVGGVGVGPALLLGENGGFTSQTTLYASVTLPACAIKEPFPIVSPYYRWTHMWPHQKEGGVFLKGLALINGKRDTGACLQD